VGQVLLVQAVGVLEARALLVRGTGLVLLFAQQGLLLVE
jgi:hypothetical protein